MLDLAVVLPVYNEEDCISQTLNSWLNALNELKIKFKILVLNDGSTDSTPKILELFSGNEQIQIVNKINSGHGPTILTGYKNAVLMAQWVFQCDSDNEIDSKYFAALWEKRSQFDALLGVRKGRKQNLSRSIISFFARITVNCFMGNKINDANVPYRLIRSCILKPALALIPQETFTPNIIISAILSRAKVRIYETPVPCQGRKTGAVSIVRWKLWKSALKAFFQVLACRKIVKKVNNLEATAC